MVTCSRRPQSVGGERGARLGRSRAHRNPALAREALDARALRPERGEAGLLGVRRAGYGRIWRDMAGYGGIWSDMVRYGQIWRDTSRYRKKIVRTRAKRLGSRSERAGRASKLPSGLTWSLGEPAAAHLQRRRAPRVAAAQCLELHALHDRQRRQRSGWHRRQGASNILRGRPIVL